MDYALTRKQIMGAFKQAFLVLLLNFLGVSFIRLTRAMECSQKDKFCTEIITGVTFCNDELVLDVKRQSLVGTISSEIGKFTSATSANFKGNILVGTIPSEIGLMESLTGLGLGKNYLTGTIPEEIYQMSNLGWINLGDVPVSGNLSSKVGNLKNVFSFELFGSNVGGTIPTEIGLLESVLWLHMNDNDFSGTIPKEITTLPKLADIKLKGNKKLCNPGIVFGEGIGNDLNEIALCPGTSYKDAVTPTRITYPPASEQANSSCVSKGCEADGLECNQNTGYCEMQDIFGEKKSLSTRNISKKNCGLVGAISEKLCKLKALEVLELKQNRIIGKIPACIFELKNLKHISLGANEISGTIPGSIGRLEKLTYLDASATKLSGQLPTELGELVNLKHLDLEAMKIVGTLPSEIGKLVNLEYFRMSGNTKFGGGEHALSSGTVDVLPTEVGNLLKLKHLDVSNLNFLGDIPSEIGKLRNLKVLNIGGSFKPQNGLPSQLGALRELVFLNVRANRIHHPIPTEIGLLESLTQLQVGQNKIPGSIPTEIGRMKNLTNLSLEDNKLTGSLPSEVGSMANLIRISLQQNELSKGLPSELGKLESLKLIDVRANSFSMPIPSELGKLYNMRILLLGNNKFSGKIPSELGHLTLYQIDLSGNSDLSGNLPEELGRLKELRGTLAIDGNLTGEIPSTFGNLIHINKLDLSGNSFTGEIPAGLGRMQSLSFLSLRNNLLGGGVPYTLTALTKLKQLKLGNNPLNLVCDCKLLSWYGTTVDNLVYDSADMIGCSPDNGYEGLAVHTLQSDKHAPCSHAVIFPGNSSTTNSVTFNWSYSIWTYSGRYLSEFNDPNRPKTNITLEMRKGIRSCKAFWIEKNKATEFAKFGFEIVANPGGIRKCFAADELHIGSNAFSHTMANLNAFQRYDISIRAVIFNKDEANTTDQRISFIYGPRSKSFHRETLQWKPDAPIHIFSPSAGDRQLTLQWDRPMQSNGRIILYRIKAETPNKENTIHFTSPKEDITMYTLTPNTLYSVSVQAETAAGAGNWSSPVNVMTCSENMRRNVLSNSNNCFAIVGYFQANSVESKECSDILNFIEPDSCLVAGLTIESLLIRKGYWRESLSSPNIRPCPNVDFCQQTTPKDINTTDKYCTNKHTGVYCQACKEPYVLVNGEGCIECTEEEISEDATILVFYWVFLILIPILLICFLVKRSLKKKKKPQVKKNQRGVKSVCSIVLEGIMGVKLRILFGFLQVFIGFANTFLARAIEEDTRSTLNFVININLGDLLSSLSINCAWDVTHYDILFIYTSFPICFLLCLKMTEVILKHCNPAKFDIAHYLEDAKLTILTIMFFIYPGVSSLIFATFSCEYFEYADGVLISQSALRVDYQLDCNLDARRIGMLVYASFMVLIYPIGILVVYSAVLGVFSKATGVNDDAGSKLLTYPYKTDTYWYELFEMSRKLIQTTLALIVFSLDSENYAINAVASHVVTVIYLCIAFRLNAYKDWMDFWFAIISLSLLSALCLLALVTEVSSTYVKVSEGIVTIVVLEVVIYVLVVILEIIKQIKTKNKANHQTMSHPTTPMTEPDQVNADADDDAVFIQKMNDELEELYDEKQSRKERDVRTLDVEHVILS